jgi:hypothetical protein
VTPKQRPKLNNERPLIQAEGVEHRDLSRPQNAPKIKRESGAMKG